MTTLAIIGGGIVGSSLLYTLAKERKQFGKVTLFSSDDITIPCSLNSTAVAALRGTVKGLSTLGDQLVDGFTALKEHVELESPLGVEKIFQFSAASKNLDQFNKRHPGATLSRRFFLDEILLEQEEAFLFEPRTYLNWLRFQAQALEQFELEVFQDMVVDISEGERVSVKTLNGRTLFFDRVVFAGGSYNRFWKNLIPDSKLKTSRPVPGSYLEYLDVLWNEDSFSLTLNGDNIVWNKPLRKLLIGSTSTDDTHCLPRLAELKDIYLNLRNGTTLMLPPFEKGMIKTGLREKAQKRESYIVSKGKISFIGGLYKNAFGVSLSLSRSFTRQLL